MIFNDFYAFLIFFIDFKTFAYISSQITTNQNHKCPVQDFWAVGGPCKNQERQYCVHQDPGGLLAARPGPEQPNARPKQTKTKGMGPTETKALVLSNAMLEHW